MLCFSLQKVKLLIVGRARGAEGVVTRRREYVHVGSGAASMRRMLVTTPSAPLALSFLITSIVFVFSPHW